MSSELADMKFALSRENRTVFCFFVSTEKRCNRRKLKDRKHGPKWWSYEPPLDTGPETAVEATK